MMMRDESNIDQFGGDPFREDGEWSFSAIEISRSTLMTRSPDRISHPSSPCPPHSCPGVVCRSESDPPRRRLQPCTANVSASRHGKALRLDSAFCSTQARRLDACTLPRDSPPPIRLTERLYRRFSLRQVRFVQLSLLSRQLSPNTLKQTPF